MPPNPLAPLLTERDPIESAEGGLDPLGTEALALRQLRDGPPAQSFQA